MGESNHTQTDKRRWRRCVFARISAVCECGINTDTRPMSMAAIGQSQVLKRLATVAFTAHSRTGSSPAPGQRIATKTFDENGAASSCLPLPQRRPVAASRPPCIQRACVTCATLVSPCVLRCRWVFCGVFRAFDRRQLLPRLRLLPLLPPLPLPALSPASGTRRSPRSTTFARQTSSPVRVGQRRATACVAAIRRRAGVCDCFRFDWGALVLPPGWLLAGVLLPASAATRRACGAASVARK